MKDRTSLVVSMLLVITVSALAGSCADLSMPGYRGSDLPPAGGAVIEEGVFVRIERVDATDPGSRRSMAVPPGRHTVEVSLSVTQRSDMVPYSREKAYLTFDAVAGHRYVINGSWSPHWWTADVVDETTNEKIARSQPMRVRVEWHTR